MRNKWNKDDVRQLKVNGLGSVVDENKQRSNYKMARVLEVQKEAMAELDLRPLYFGLVSRSFSHYNPFHSSHVRHSRSLNRKSKFRYSPK